MNYLERKRDEVSSGLKAMEVDNCEDQNQNTEDKQPYDNNPEDWQEVNYMKGKGKGKGQWWDKGFNQFPNPQGKWKGLEKKGMGEREWSRR